MKRLHTYAEVAEALKHCDRATCVRLALGLARLVAEPCHEDCLDAVERSLSEMVDLSFITEATVGGVCLHASKVVVLAAYAASASTVEHARVHAARAVPWAITEIALRADPKAFDDDPDDIPHASAAVEKLVLVELLRDPSPALVCYLL